MSESGIPFKVEARDARGKGPMRRLRAQGKVPGVVYGHGDLAVPVAMGRSDLFHHLRKVGKTRLVTFDTDVKELSGTFGVIREVQRDPVSREFLHADFQQVDLDEVIYIEVPLNFVGTAAGEKAGGARGIRTYELGIRCKAAEIPDHIDVDITNMKIGDVLLVRDLVLPEGVALATTPAKVVLTIERRRKAVVAAAAEVAAEGEPAEGEAAEAAEA